MGQYKNRGPYKNLDKYNEVKDNPAAFESLIQDIKSAFENEEDKHIKADLGAAYTIFQAIYYKDINKNLLSALEESRKLINRKKTLKLASAYWESLSYRKHADICFQLGNFQEAIDYYTLAASVLLKYYNFAGAAVYCWSKSSEAAEKLNRPDLSSSFTQQAIEYRKQWADKYKDKNRWVKTQKNDLKRLQVALEAQGLNSEAKRITKEIETLRFPDKEKLQKDLRDPTEMDEIETPEQAFQKLEEMVGLESVKNQIESLSNFMAIQEKRQLTGKDPVSRSNHFVFSGPPGTGKTTVARLLAKILFSFGQLPSDTLTEVSPAELIAGYRGQTAIKTRKVVEEALGGVLFIDEAYQLGGADPGKSDKGFGGEAIAELILAMENNRDKLCVVFAGYDQEMNRFLDTNPGLSNRLSETIKFEAYTNDELKNIFLQLVDSRGYKLDPAAEAKLISVIGALRSYEKERFGNGRAMRNLFEDVILRHAQRISRISEKEISEEQLSLLQLEDLTNDKISDRTLAVEEAMIELNKLVGLDEVKKQVQDLKSLLEVRRNREAQGLQNPDRGNHLIFAGPPGTGKTTVARILSKVFYGLEQLPSDRVIEATRSDLVAEYVGQTAVKTGQLLRSARGGVLFIDEAYTLAAGANDFGSEAIAELIKFMEDESDNLIVVLAGYSEDMEKLLNSNPGFRSRISQTIEFPAYTPEQLFEILNRRLEYIGYKLNPNDTEHVKDICAGIAAEPEEIGGNARDIRKLIDSALLAQASRIANTKSGTKDLETLNSADFIWEPKNKRKPIGFAFE